MNSLIVWVVLAVPKQICKDAELAHRLESDRAASVVAVTTMSIEAINAAIANVKAIPHLDRAIALSFEKPVGNQFGDCFEVYTAPVKVSFVTPPEKK